MVIGKRYYKYVARREDALLRSLEENNNFSIRPASSSRIPRVDFEGRRDSPAEKYFSWKSRKKKLEKAGGALNGKSRRILLFGRALVSRSASVV